MFWKKSPRTSTTGPNHLIVESLYTFYHEITKPIYAFTMDGKHTRDAVFELRKEAGEAHFYLSRIEQFGPPAEDVEKVITLWEAVLILFTSLNAEYDRDALHNVRGDVVNDIYTFMKPHLRR